MNDPITRQHLVRGMGLCARHAWDLQALEQHHWADGIGHGVIYGDLTDRVLGALMGCLAGPAASRRGDVQRLADRARERLRAWLNRRGRWGHRLAQRLPPRRAARELLARLSPARRCRVCQIADESEVSDVVCLVRRLTGAEFRADYAASDGLCLPHLRRALAE